MLEEYFEEVLEYPKLAIGSLIRLLPNLAYLYLDFAANGNQFNFSALRNYFEWDSNNQGAVCFPSLKTVDIVNTGPVTSYALDDEEFLQFFYFSGQATWVPNLVLRAFITMPSLNHWRVSSEAKGAADFKGTEPEVQSLMKNGDTAIHSNMWEEEGDTFFAYQRVSTAEADEIINTIRAGQHMEL